MATAMASCTAPPARRISAEALLASIVRRQKFKAGSGEVLGAHTPRMREALAEARGDLEPAMLKADQGNSSIVFGNSLVLKLFRKLEHGINPEREAQEFLTDKAGFRHMSQYLGCLEYRPQDPDEEPITLGILGKFTRRRSTAGTTPSTIWASSSSACLLCRTMIHACATWPPWPRPASTSRH